MRHPLVLALAAALAAAPAAAAVDAADAPAATPPALDLRQAMAHPDWIGPPVELAWWSLDGAQLHYLLKREGSPVRDTWRVGADGGESLRLDDAALAAVDGAAPVFDGARGRAAFVRDGDVFVRHLADGRLEALTRSAEEEADVAFATTGGVVFRRGEDWLHAAPGGGALATVAQLRTGDDPAAPPAADALREHQLRLIATLARERAAREAAREAAEARRAADPGRAAAPVYLGAGLSLQAQALSPALTHVVAVVEPEGADAGRAGQMPRYVTESGYEDMEDVRTRVGRNPPAGQSLRLVALAGGQVREVSLDALPGIATDPLAADRAAAGLPALEGQRPVRVEGVRWNDAGTLAAVTLRSVDNKDRWIAVLDPAAAGERAALRPLHRLTDPGWINWAFNESGWLPDGRSLWLLSEHTGYSHLYVVDATARSPRPRALTQGRWETSEVAASPDGARLWFLCNRAWPGDYEVCEVPVAGGEVREITALDGVESFAPSPDGRRLAVRASSPHVPAQLHVVGVDGAGARQLTDTRTADYRARTWLAPRIVQVPSSDGAGTIWGKLYRPGTLEPGRRYPVVMFVHGAGYLQNVHARFPVYFREQMFHQLLVERGYLVLDLDFRASAGYGRDWRTAIYRRMGTPELRDYLDGIDWLAAEHQADPARVGIYGGSYGGFMAFMAMFNAPDRFVAGAALRPVTDWRMYNHEYTSNILDTPELAPEAYRTSSPIEHAEGLRGHLLIAHGMIDDNVFYQDSVRLAQRLIELGKPRWELASYPLERHAYQHPESWHDQYRRIYELFERTIGPDAPASARDVLAEPAE